MWLRITDRNYGTQWVNLEQVLAIEFKEGPGNPGAPMAQIFWFTTHVTTYEASEVAALRRWVEEHQYRG